MEDYLGIGFVILLIAFVWWREKRDIKVNGKPSKVDRKKESTIALITAAVLILVAWVSAMSYVIVCIVLWVIYQVIGIGGGKHGWYRQLRDGCFMGWVFSVPVGIFYVLQSQT
jgi:hypothetical protein